MAVEYSWALSRVDAGGDELITPTVKLFLQACAYRIRSDARYETEPTLLSEFEEMTGLSDRGVRQVRDLLARIGEVELGGPNAPDRTVVDGPGRTKWPKRAIYRLPGLAGPLFMTTRWSVDGGRNAAPRAEFHHRKSAPRAEFQPPNPARGAEFATTNAAPRAGFPGKSRHHVPRFDANAGGVPFSEVVRTEEHDHDDALIAPRLQTARTWLESFYVKWSQANGGAPYAREVADLDIALELLAQYAEAKPSAADHLTAMADSMLSRSRVEGDFISGGDRSLRVLRKAALTLTSDVARHRSKRTPTVVSSCHPSFKHDPPCGSVAACLELERQLVAARSHGASV